MSRVPHPSVASLEIRCQKMESLIKICAHFGFESKLQNNANLSTLCGVKNDGFAKKMYIHLNNISYIDFLQNEGQSAKTVVQTPAGSKRESRCWSLMRRLQSTASALSRLSF